MNLANVKDRSKGIGGSDVGALFGLSKWMPLPKLYLQKTGKLFAQNERENEPAEWGTDFEDIIARRFSKKTGRQIRRIGRTLTHPRYPFMVGNPDRFQWDRKRPHAKRRGVLEIKATMFANLKPWSMSGIPANYYLQLQHYLVLTGCTWGSFAVLFGGNKLVNFDVERDEQLIAVMIEREREFWELVQKQTPPPITLSAEWNKHLAAFFPESIKGVERVLDTPAAIGRARRYLTLCQQIERREAEIEEHEVFFKSELREAERLLVPGIARFSWSSFERKHADLDKLRTLYPAIAEEITTKQPQRRFSCKGLVDLVEADDEIEPAPVPMMGARRIELD